MSTRRFDRNADDQNPDQDTRRLDSDHSAPAAPAVNVCPKCHGDMIYANARTYNNSASVYVEGISKYRRGGRGGASKLLALVCIICGYTELYATDPKILLEP